MAYLLRQTCQVAGAYANPVGGATSLVANFPQGILLGSYIVCCQVIYGPDHGKDVIYVGPTEIPVGGPVHPSGGGQDVGTDVAALNASCDILWWAVSATEAGSTQITFKVGGTNTNYGACWAGEYLQPDRSAYSYFNGSDGTQPIDSSYGWNGSGANVALARTGGQTVNNIPGFAIWALGVLGPQTIQSHDHMLEGWVTDGANVGMLVTDDYYNATGAYTASAILSASQNYVAANAAFKTLSYPVGALRGRVGVGIGAGVGL